MTVLKEENFRVIGGEFRVSRLQLAKLIENDPLMAKIHWTKEDRKSVLQKLQKILNRGQDGIEVILDLFGGAGPILSLFNVHNFQLLLAVTKDGGYLLSSVYSGTFFKKHFSKYH
jgi:hypothetical protein